MDLLTQIRSNVLDPRADLPSILRKARVLASVLQNPEFKQWVGYELNGYPNTSLVPEYRKIISPPLGTFLGSFGSSVHDQIMPMINMPEVVHKFAEDLALMDGVKELEAMARDRKTLRRTWPPELVIIMRDHVRMSGGMVLAEVYQPVPPASIEGIIDAVRNRLLDFILELQELAPNELASEQGLSQIPKDAVSQIFNVTIQGGQNVIAAGTGISQSVTQSVVAHDEEALLQHLRSIGIPDDDIRTLREAIQEDDPVPPPGFGKRVRAWIGKMLSKADEGAWQIAVQAAPTLLIKALEAYYGLPK